MQIFAIKSEGLIQDEFDISVKKKLNSSSGNITLTMALIVNKLARHISRQTSALTVRELTKSSLLPNEAFSIYMMQTHVFKTPENANWFCGRPKDEELPQQAS